ncbi:MAG: transposase [Gammaproteobacteria bacterium]|nr:transposase [Gammaproteobacteria bacterium]
MKESRRNHSSQLKARIALEAVRGKATLAELASRHGVHVEKKGTPSFIFLFCKDGS